MPARDGTGPYGTGPIGRGFGSCGRGEQAAGNDQPFGMGRAHHRGRRFQNRQPHTGWRASTPEEEMRLLQNRQTWLREQLDAVTSEIENRSKPAA